MSPILAPEMSRVCDEAKHLARRNIWPGRPLGVPFAQRTGVRGVNTEEGDNMNRTRSALAVVAGAIITTCLTAASALARGGSGSHSFSGGSHSSGGSSGGSHLVYSHGHYYYSSGHSGL